ncbi:MAG TPA: hypothetical protein VKY27_04660 [Bacteriovoracaceae bacterium]|nr:hypothetical protein [Bacteriovoracaceae bacterium]
MVNHWKMGQTFKTTIFLLLLGILASCNLTEAPAAKKSNKFLSNNDGSLNDRAYVFLESPSILLGNKATPGNPGIEKILHHQSQLITGNTQLTQNCSVELYFNNLGHTYNLANCLRSLSNKENLTLLTKKEDNTWIFPVGSDEFYQVNTLYHLQKGVNTFFDKLQFSYGVIHGLGNSVPKALPPYIGAARMFWFNGIVNTDSQTFRNNFLTSYSKCNLFNNAYFSPAGPELCFGHHDRYSNFFFAQDPSIIYHELAHALVSVMMNFRNGTATSTHPFRSNLGSYGYNEASSINEGIADYFSFVMNGRKHVGEWSLGVLGKQSRPLHEDDPIHIPALKTTPEGRLSYPHYLLYDPNYPDSPHEDVHYAGQIVTHYLVALTEQLKNKCGLRNDADKGHERATSYVMLLLSETLAELGDLNAKGIDAYGAPFNANIYFKNLDPKSSFLWAHEINPPNYRSFFQTFAKNINKYVSASPFGLCPNFDQYESEKLLDDYGLLLFKDYNDKGVSTKNRSITYSHAVHTIPSQTLTKVPEGHRRKSVLVSKDLLDLATPVNSGGKTVYSYYIIDSQTAMRNLLTDLLFKGLSVPLSDPDVADISFNNNNIDISPGEIVGVIPNLHNSSNSTIAGVQLLATDWDHAHIDRPHSGNFKPCVFDSVTTVDQGGEAGQSCLSENGYPDTDYKRLVKNSNGQFPTDAAAPVCFVELSDEDSTRWVSQNEYRQANGNTLTDNKCLGYSTNGVTDEDFTFNPHECLVRFLPGANTAYFSRIDPQSNYYDSVVKKSENKEFNSGNLLIMEVNKWVKPGTKFRCRLRARFSNCSDCYNDPQNNYEEYLDSDLNGHKPYKIINFDFTVYE